MTKYAILVHGYARISFPGCERLHRATKPALITLMAIRVSIIYVMVFEEYANYTIKS